ncbi:M16 family metallopeptidase [Kallotenue papyrolyticum]|uniref:M16 family metallopeptidase n=1 Tax=Kallotenue papyrolyticum TaxID=1325125 RepID=UPI0004B87666|nr:pitrilysin family protein [Kallotenue papyrolyticum]
MSQTIHTRQLANGLTVAVEAMPHLRSVAWTLLLPTGSASDPEGLSGAMQVLNGMVYRGAGERDARALSDALDALGVQRGGRVDVEYTTFGGAALADDLGAALALYADIVRRPRLPAEELEAERALALQAVRALNDQPTQRLFVELGKTYFPGPFGRSVLGELDELQRLDHATLIADAQRRLRPAGGVLAVAGGVAPQQVFDLAEQLFGDWQGAPPPLPRPQPRQEPCYRHIEQDTSQTQIAAAYASLPLDDPAYYHERLALNVLSGSGMSTRLFVEVRGKRGLVYSVGAFPRIHRGLGVVLAYAGTQPDRAQETVDVLLGELRRIRQGVRQDELDRARVSLLAALVMQGESTGARAGAMASDVFLIGRPRTLDEIRSAVEAVTLDSLNTYLAERPEPRFTVVTLGPKPVTV